MMGNRSPINSECFEVRQLSLTRVLSDEDCKDCLTVLRNFALLSHRLRM